MSKSSQRRRIQMERLEDRRMMAGDFSATVNTDGTLVILEAGNSIGGAQAVEVSQLPNGKIRVSGATSPANPAGSIVRNLAGKDIGTPVFSGVKNIVINVGDGPDQVWFGVGATKPFFPSIGSVTINTEGPAGSARDNDEVLVHNLAVSKSLDIRTGAGQDTVSVVDSVMEKVNYDYPSLTVMSGTTSALGEADRDKVTIDGVTVKGQATIETGASGDTVTVKNSDFGLVETDLTSIRTGAGADVVNIGSDDSEFGFVSVRGDLILDVGSESQTDADTLRVRDLDVVHSLSLSLGGGDDRLDMDNTTVRKDMLLTAMSGNDTVEMVEVEVWDNLFAKMGAGDDTLDMIGVKARKVEADGGSGANDKLFAYDMLNVPLIKSGFEQINGKPIAPKRTGTGSLDLPTIETGPRQR